MGQAARRRALQAEKAEERKVVVGQKKAVQWVRGGGGGGVWGGQVGKGSSRYRVVVVGMLQCRYKRCVQSVQAKSCACVGR